MTSQISKVITAIRFPLIMLVVLIHVPRGGSQGFWYNFITNLLSTQLSGIAVPMFFVISGYLFFSNYTAKSYVEKLKRRICSLLIPYLIWNTLALVMLVAPHSHNYEYTFANVLSSYWDCHYSFIGASGHSPIDYPLWYVRDLMVCCILSPVIYYGVRYLKVFVPLVIIAMWIIGIDIHIAGISIIAIAFFSLGAYCSVHCSDSIVHDSMYICVGFLAFVVISAFSAVAQLSDYTVYLTRFATVLGVFCTPSIFSITISKFTKLNDALVALSSSTFFVYASHAIIIKPLYRALPFVNETTKYFVTYIGVLVICMVAYTVLKKYMPKTLNFLIGK